MTPAIELRDVGKVYDDGVRVQALAPTDLVFADGSYTAIVGPSGSGKSTLLNLVGLLDEPTGGQVLIQGVDTTALSANERALLRGRLIGFVFQAFHLVPGRTALENVQLGLVYQRSPRKERVRRAVDVLEQVGLSHRMAADPRTLSGGERQRVAIARALAASSAILLCDEPTGNLDQETGASILTLLRDLHREGRTVVAVTHDRDVAAEAERVVTVVDGVVSTT